MALRRVDVIGTSLPILAQIGENEEASDYRPVPASDNGRNYQDQGMLGSYAPSNREPWGAPEGLKFDSGFGADREDFERGFVEPRLSEHPAYDKSNYDMRSTIPRSPSEDFGNTDVMDRDLEFRRRNQNARGFLTRPRIPTER